MKNPTAAEGAGFCVFYFRFFFFVAVEVLNERNTELLLLTLKFSLRNKKVTSCMFAIIYLNNAPC